MDRARFDILMDRFADGLATPAEMDELTSQLKESPELRRAFVERNQLEVLIHDVISTQAVAERPSVRIQTTRRARRKATRQSGWGVPLGIAAALLLAVGVVFLLNREGSEPVRREIARLESTTGARVVRGEQEKPGVQNEKIFADDSILTSETGSAEVTYADGTRVTIAPNSHVKLSDADGSKKILLHSGQVTASIRKQPISHPMYFATAQAQAIVVGTELKFSQRAGETRLEVTEGLVRLQRLSDGKIADVSAGQVAISSEGKELAAVTMPAETQRPLRTLATPVLNETFENGQMEGWIQSSVVAGRGDGGRHVLEATQIKGETPAIIFSAVKLPLVRLSGGTRDNEWIFVYQPDLILQFSYFLDADSGAIRVQAFNNELDDNFNAVIEKPVVGRWTTVQVQLNTVQHNDSKRAAQPLSAGTHFRNLQFHCGSASQKLSKFQLDNVIVAPASTKN